MPDIRSTGLIDDFERPDELEADGGIFLPWIRSPTSPLKPELNDGSLAGVEFPPTRVDAYYADAAFGGPRVETWGIQGGSAALTDAWRFGMWTAASVGNNAETGFSCIFWDNIGGTSWFVRRYENGVNLGTIHDVGGALGGDNSIALMQYNEDSGLLETWHNVSGDEVTWVVRNSVVSAGLTGPWVFHYGMTGVETGWGAVGGGAIRRTQIYRYITN